MRLLRRVVFYCFVAVFLIACPRVMLYALGYSVRPGAQAGLVKTGLIYLATTPPGASVYLGNRRYTKTTPTVLRGLLPGRYPVKLVLKHYKPWNHSVSVEAEKATVMASVLLVPNAWPVSELLRESFDALIPIVGTATVLLQRGQTLRGLLVFRWKDGQLWSFVGQDTPYRDARVMDILTVPGSPVVLVRVGDQNDERLLWVDTAKQEHEVVDLTSVLPVGAEHVAWDPHERHHLFALERGALTRVDVTTPPVAFPMFTHVRGYGLFNRAVYLLTEEGELLRTHADGTFQELLLADLQISHSLFGRREGVRMIVYADDLVFLISGKGELLTNRLPYRLIDKAVRGMAWHPHRQRLLVWQKDQLGILEPSSAPSTVTDVLKVGPPVRWFVTGGRNITQAFWVADGSHLLFHDEDNVRLLTLEAHGDSVVHDVARVKPQTAILYDDDLGTLVYLDRTSGHLAAIEILPPRGLLLLPFPERTEPFPDTSLRNMP